MVICLQRGADDLHMVQLRCQCRLSPLASLKSTLVQLSGAGLPRLLWKKAVKRVSVCHICSNSTFPEESLDITVS